MVRQFRILSALFGALLAPALLEGQASGIPVYLEPSTEADVVTRVQASDPAYADASPVLDETRAAQGWFWTEYLGTFNGFVTPASVTKSLEVRPDTVVYLRPDTDSPILTILREGDPASVVESGDWVEIEFEKTVPVYIKKDPAPTTDSDRGESDMDTSVPTPGPSAPGAAAGAATATAATSGNGSADEEEAIDQLETLKIDDLTGEGRELPAPRLKPADSLARNFQGTFRRAKYFLGIRKPKFTYELIGPNKKRIAWVDTSGLLVPRLDTFEGEQVTLYGELVEGEKPKDLTLKARYIRKR
ncbi:MAG: hypothetical protein ACFE0O_13620 [Opitutales bacterium]